MRTILWIQPAVRRLLLLTLTLTLLALGLAVAPGRSAAQTEPAVAIRSNPPTTVGQTVSFGILSSSGSGTLRYSWDFGDGTPPTAFSTSSTASHAYAGPGHFRVWVTVMDGAGATAFSSYVHTSHYALSAARPSASSTIILDGARNRVWAVNPDNDSVTAINGATHARLFEAAVGRLPRTLAQAPDGTIWVVNQAAATISVLNPDSGALLQTISLPSGLKAMP